MLCADPSFTSITSVASKHGNVDILCMGCPAHSGFSHSAADFWGSQLWAHVQSPPQILGKPGPCTYTQEFNSFQRNYWFFFPFHVCMSLLSWPGMKFWQEQRWPEKSSGSRISEMGTVMTTDSLQWHHHPKKKGLWLTKQRRAFGIWLFFVCL